MRLFHVAAHVEVCVVPSQLHVGGWGWVVEEDVRGAAVSTQTSADDTAAGGVPSPSVHYLGEAEEARRGVVGPRNVEERVCPRDFLPLGIV